MSARGKSVSWLKLITFQNEKEDRVKEDVNGLGGQDRYILPLPTVAELHIH